MHSPRLIGFTIILIVLTLLTIVYHQVKAVGDINNNVVGCYNTRTGEVSVAPNTANSTCYMGGREPRYWRKVTYQDAHMETYKSIGASETEALTLAAIKSLECSAATGACVGPDIGPFQINRAVHKVNYNKSYKLIKEERYGELFKYQAKWTLDRTKRVGGRLCKTMEEGGSMTLMESQACKAKHHNGNVKVVYNHQLNVYQQLRDEYAFHFKTHRRIIKEYIKGKTETVNVNYSTTKVNGNYVVKGDNTCPMVIYGKEELGTRRTFKEACKKFLGNNLIFNK